MRIDSAAVGGAGVARDPDGRVVFVNGALPGELVDVEISTTKKRFARGATSAVIEPSPARIEPVCATARAGCGGCDLPHARIEEQRRMKERVVTDSLQRIARLDHIPPVTTRTTLEARYRTTLRAAVVEGRAGYRRRSSHDVVVAGECRVAHPAAEELLTTGTWGSSREVTIRVSAATGQRIAIVDDIDGVEVPDDVVIVGPATTGDPFLTEEAAGRAWQVGARSFFQAGPAAASGLVEAVTAAVGSVADASLVDAYGGVGLFGGSVGARADHVTLVEVSASSCRDARVNLDSNGGTFSVVLSRVENWAPESAAVVVADPSRAGLGQRAVDVLAATGAERFVLVSCDPGSLGRDVGLLVAAGYRLQSVELVDAFPDTSHIETVVGFVR